MRIALVSDTHLAERVANFTANWQAVRAWIDAVSPDLVIHLGDITVNGTDDAEELVHARGAFEGLGAPIRFLPGNHDIGDNPVEPGAPASHPLNPTRLADHRRLFGPDWWSIEAEGWQLVGLDAQLLGTGGAEEEAQFAWLDATLAAHCGPLGLLLHKPLFRDRPEDTEAHIRYVPSRPRRRLFGLLAGRDLRFVAAGHTHQLRQHSVDGVEHVWTPSAAFCITDAMQERIGEKVVGTMLLELTPVGHRFSLERPTGLRRLNLLDHPEAYPAIAELKARLGAAAQL
jgi:3',5'-cyclic AMP phosphodiesterase CpdA